VANLDFSDRSRIRNREIGFIFQSFNLIGDLTVYENVELPLTYRDGMPSAERKRRVLDSLERVGMAHRLRHYPSQLPAVSSNALRWRERWPDRLPSCWRRAYGKPGFA